MVSEPERAPGLVALDDQLHAAIADGQDTVIALHLKASRLGEDGLPLRHVADRLAVDVSAARDAAHDSDAVRKVLAYADLVAALNALPL